MSELFTSKRASILRLAANGVNQDQPESELNSSSLQMVGSIMGRVLAFKNNRIPVVFTTNNVHGVADRKFSS